MPLYAVINGDFVGSTRWSDQERDLYFMKLKMFLSKLRKKTELGIFTNFEIFRGDSFQGVLKKPEKALQVMIMIQCYLRTIPIEMDAKRKVKLGPGRPVIKPFPTVRMACGIGQVKQFSKKLMESDGEAFHLSGKLFDTMKSDKRISSMKKGGITMTIKSPWEKENESLDIICSFLEVLTDKISSQQAQVILLKVLGRTEMEIAKEIRTSQPAVYFRSNAANWWVLLKILGFYENLILRKLK